MKFVYSYSHDDENFREDMEKHLVLLRNNGLIDEWHDRKMLAGSNILDETFSQLQSADIIALLLSPSFLASPSCQDELSEALRLERVRGTKVVPIIVRPCAWLDMPEISQLAALPFDSLPVTKWSSQDEAFLNVYEGIKSVVEDMRFSLKTEFESKLTDIEFISQNKENIRIDDIFVFPNIVRTTDRKSITVKSFDNLWDAGDHLILQGDDRSGKTTICKKLFLNCISENVPAIMISGRDITSRSRHEDLIGRKFKEQFHGQYEKWKMQTNKTLIVDDFNNSSRIQFLDFAKGYFFRIFVVISQDNYIAYFRDEEKLANYELLSLRSLGHSQQEYLIRRWKSLNNSGPESESIAHGDIDQIEDRLNSIIHNNKIVPRYPFYILSILQTYEGFMPQGIQITAYGHCYHALIVAQLLKYGIENEDIDSAFNLLTMFAFRLFDDKEKNLRFDVDKFLSIYRERFVIKDGVINRLMNNILIEEEGRYRFYYLFAYYFFLGRFFASNYIQHEDIVEQLAEKSYLRDNRYILIFMIHHTYQDDLINVILSHTKTAMERLPVAELSAGELKPLVSALGEIPQKIVSRRSVEVERKAERDQRDRVEDAELDKYDDEQNEHEDLNSVYRSLKNMEILGQILRNKYGSFPKEKLREIVKTIADAGLRLVRFVTDEDSISSWEDYLSERAEELEPKKNTDRMKNLLGRQVRTLCFFIMTALILKVVASIRKPELAEVVKEVCQETDTPAYDLIGFFFVLETASEIQERDVDSMEALITKFDRSRNDIARRLLSITTQDYLNKHSLQYWLRQKIYKQLSIDYRPNPTNMMVGKERGRRRRPRRS